MELVNNRGERVNERGEPLDKKDEALDEEDAFQAPMCAFVQDSVTVGDYYGLASCSKVVLPEVGKDECVLGFKMDLDGLEILSRPVSLDMAVNTRGACLAQGLLEGDNFDFGYNALFYQQPVMTRGKLLVGRGSRSRTVLISFASVEQKELKLVLRLCAAQEGREEAVAVLERAFSDQDYAETVQNKLSEV